MREVVGNLWHYWKKPKTVILVTTNGTVRSDGHLVMGRGCALEAKQRIFGLSKGLGSVVLRSGNKIYPYRENKKIRLLTFPVKHNWWETADLKLIKKSASDLRRIVLANPHTTFVLPRPGCGNGELKWETVKKVIEQILDMENLLVISKPN